MTPSIVPATGPEPNAPRRSSFVTMLAWLAIAGAGTTAMFCLVQAIVYYAYFARDFDAMLAALPGVERLPRFARLVILHPEYALLASGALSVATIAAGIALLRRRNWARLYFIALLALAIVWEIFQLWFQRQLGTMALVGMKDLPANVTSEFEDYFQLISIATMAFSIFLGVLYVWLISRLVSPAVRAEFGAATAPADRSTTNGLRR